MATILLQAAGAYLGGMLGPVGSAIGTAAGALVGFAVDTALINATRRIEGPRLTGARPFTAEEGVSLPRVYGTARMGGILIWATRFEESSETRRQGKLGPRVTQYTYYANAAFALCEGEIAGIRRVWADGREIDRESIELRIYQGGEDQPQDPLIEAKQGEGNTPAYRGVAYVVLDRIDVGDYGNRIPQLQFEVIRPIGRLSGQVRAVSLLPGAIEYGLSPVIVTRTRRPGEEAAVNRNVLFAGTDIAASLDELQAVCPRLEHVALISTWFGDDLRAGSCRVRPAVTEAGETGFSSPWVVSGLPRAEAPVVSYHDGGAAYGGTPSDRSVLDAIAEIKARGLSVTLYPFMMMDIATDNALPDPEGRAAQPPYPWRGRITCDPAPGRDGSADKTAGARAQVVAFCGTARSADFSANADTVRFFGADDWGYRRLVLHYAHLAAMAGGVDAFLIGSELRGLTRLRDDDGRFPFVEELCTLAADVRAVLGPDTRITYGADWSEYFGYHPADGSGDVYFNLDPLWSHPAVDAVGIDNYMPLSDWHDADYAGGNPDGFRGPYDPDGLEAAVAGGEGFDWYYPSAEARAGRIRAAITDGAYAKPWTYRYKDIVSWWSNAHYDRVGGVEQPQPTAWAPRGKPVWLTELGCPAVDKGPNQPNVFPDPKSSESGAPYFSTGGRSDVAARRFLDAHLEHWDDTAPGFEDSANPLSPVYGGRMLDVSRIYLWSWDARPFPAFPLRSDLWSDGNNWNLGHWLNGRLGSADLGALINAILADHGQPPAGVDNADGTVQGYVLDDPTSARAALEPLVDLFDLAVIEEPGRLVFRTAGATGEGALEVDELVLPSGGGPAVETARAPDHELPAEAVLTFRDPMIEYQAASVRAIRLGAEGSRQHAMGFPGVLEKGLGAVLLDEWLKRTWYQREIVTFCVWQPRDDIVPGAIVRLPQSNSPSEFLVTGIEDGLVRKVSARQITRGVPAPWREQPPPGEPGTGSGGGTVVGKPHALFLDLPAEVGSGEARDQFRVAVWQKPWRSQTLSVSPEDTGFATRSIVSQAASLGRLVAPLEPGFEGRLDRAGVVLVELFDARAANVSRLQLLNGANAAALRSLSGAWEVLQFETAQETAPQVWRLGGLLRGQLGTGDAMAAGAATGADFVILDNAVAPAGLLPAEVGLLLNWRVAPSGPWTGAYAQSAEIGGLRSLLPFSPVHLRARWSGADLALSWLRRSRLGGDPWEGLEIPLGEETEQYRIDIAAPGGAVLRTATAFGPSWLYGAAAIAADFGAPPTAIELTVRQLGRAGWGVAATHRLALS